MLSMDYILKLCLEVKQQQQQHMFQCGMGECVCGELSISFGIIFEVLFFFHCVYNEIYLWNFSRVILYILGYNHPLVYKQQTILGIFRGLFGRHSLTVGRCGALQVWWQVSKCGFWGKRHPVKWLFINKSRTDFYYRIFYFKIPVWVAVEIFNKILKIWLLAGFELESSCKRWTES